LLGVEPASLEYGMTLSPEVQAALPTLLATARDVVERWRDGVAVDASALQTREPVSS
jgi:hypothetical protein